LLHLTGLNFARTCVSTTYRTLLNFKVIGKGQGHVGFSCFSVCVILRLRRTVLNLE